MAISFKPALAIAALSCAACTPVDYGLGEAVKYDMALQTIDPDPVYAPGSTEPGTSGTTNAEAAKRYRTDTVKPVVLTDTTMVSAGGSGTSSGPQ